LLIAVRNILQLEKNAKVAFSWQQLTCLIADSYIYTNNNKREPVVAFPFQQWLLNRAMI
jgi:hypothetical protein